MDGDLRFLLIGGRGYLKAVLSELLAMLIIGAITAFVTSFFAGAFRNVNVMIYLCVCGGISVMVSIFGFLFSSISIEDRYLFKDSSPKKHAAMFKKIFIFWSLPLFILFIVVFCLLISSLSESELFGYVLCLFTIVLEVHVFLTCLQIGSAVSMRKFFCKNCGTFLEVEESNYDFKKYTETKGGNAYSVNAKIGEARCGNESFDVYEKSTAYTAERQYDVHETSYNYEMYCPKCGAKGRKGTFHEKTSYRKL